MAASIAALPTVSSLVDCTDLTVTVYPYLRQLTPAHVLPLLRGEIAPTQWYLATNPVISAALFALAVSLVVLVAGEITRNCSQVDRLWSLLPVVYAGHYAAWTHLHGIPSERVDTLATFIGLWGARLTFNYWRKGGYQYGHEDYRWEVLRAKIPAALFPVFNLGFISLFQSFTLMAITCPLYIMLLYSQLPESATTDIVDTIFSRGLVIVLCIEALADQQQWSYQQAKKSYKETGAVAEGFAKEDLDRGFVVTGLWALSRHPNFACEQAIWLGVYQWACLKTDTMYNWSGLGVMAYCAIFLGSTIFTESITAAKYPDYKEYQLLVNKVVPGLGALMGHELEVKGAKKD
ncbi:hypothetical protein BZA05DRAFT_425406 [Tricharina praecox]|uniref:uncharacterized protein n=1 Tax=Tricharina praecox TaxID=43433 RepID=UPI00221E64DE|nr:uncharacterized protein BZA05DRAFT_425406 [Tricharina praecox]KAI5853516.1 hypothetical protein BZA05DRAFT_425406 [Tricharina praecox]